MREGGIKGLSIFIIFYSPILVLVGKSGYMSFLGKAMWCFIACNYINPTFGLFGGYSSFWFTHSLFLNLFLSSFILAFLSWLGMENELWEEKSHCLLVVSNC
jgi:hypothetical protein